MSAFGRLARTLVMPTLLAGVVLVAAPACTAPVVIDPAPYAADPQCASVMLGIPDEVGGLKLRPTSSQATAVYGKDAMITVRCGVEPPGPSSERCVAIDTAEASQDWLVTEDDTSWIAVSFGRAPATEVVIPKVRADQAVGEILAQFGPAVSQADSNGLACR
ncbi:MAG: DUF3515 family protein [Demequinaceae bacterium]|nr:DUF3515 family protein [Demequinaceae bacterium]